MFRSLPVRLSGLMLWWMAVGCATVPPGTPPPVIRGQNALLVSADDPEVVWERTVDVLHDYRFQIARENKLDGVIETQYKVGSSLFEPWHRDSVGLANRLESTFQSIRRRAVVTITPAQGGFLVNVEVQKELEDLAGLAANSAGNATFLIDKPLQRDLNLVVGQSTPSGWISQGRDRAVERDMLARLQSAFSP